jgi:hypothetical protein
MTATTDTTVTRTCQNRPGHTTDATESYSSAGLVAALEQCWATIRARHPEVPAAIIVVGSGSPTKANDTLKWGHFASLRWQHGSRRLPEVLVSGEGLSRTPEEIFTTLLHEATHGLADTRSIQDTSRQGRWHNKRFAKLAAELGMDTTKHDKFGYSPCTLQPATTAHFRAVIDGLAAALGAYRHAEVIETKQRASNNNGVVCECDCPRKIRLSTAVYEAGPIWCGMCDMPFRADDDTDNADGPDNPSNATNSGKEVPAMAGTRRYDPTGEYHAGTPTYPYRCAPTGLATRRQLARLNLRPGGQDIAAQILWRQDKRVAYLYRIDAALPKRKPTPAQLAALDKAMRARRTCPTCQQEQPYYIPRRWGECIDCHLADGAR